MKITFFQLSLKKKNLKCYESIKSLKKYDVTYIGKSKKLFRKNILKEKKLILPII